MKKILITGATGAIGANAVKYFVAEGYAVRAQLRPGTKTAWKIERFDVERCYVDLRDRDGLAALVEGVEEFCKG